MKVNGFNLMLQDFCDYCQHFEPEVEKIDCSAVFGGAPMCINNIRCANGKKCARIAENLENKISAGKYDLRL